MRRRLPMLLALILLVATPAVAGTSAAAAAAPPNDNRVNAQAVTAPSTVTGSTVGSTNEPGEPFFCGQSDGSVWYRLAASDVRGIVVSLTANGNLDAELAIYRQQRSRLDYVACDLTDDAGQAATQFRTVQGATYLVRVAEQPNTEPNTFTLKFVHGPPPAEPPGRALSRHGARGTLDRVLRTDAAYHVKLTAGTPYRLNLVHGAYCPSLELYPPGTNSFQNATPVFRRSCGGYGVYAPPPGTSGRYVIRIAADRFSRVAQPYTLLAGSARRDDIAPGIFIRNYAKAKGSVNGGSLDTIDLYRFDVVQHSALDLDLVGQPGRDLALELRSDSGRRLACSCTAGSDQQLTLRVKRGRYYVAIRSRDAERATYVLTRRSRQITRTVTTFNGRRKTVSAPKRAVLLRVAVSPFATGKARLTIEHFDPFQGWLPFKQHAVAVRRGFGLYRWTPPSVGRWRARADYAGAKLYAPSRSGLARLLVAQPLQQ